MVYDVNDRIAAIEDAVGVSRFEYDPEGRLVSATAREGGESFAYDAGGNRIKRNSPQGGAEDAEYDPLNRLVRQGSTTLQYDARGNVIAVSGPKGTTHYRYNGQNSAGRRAAAGRQACRVRLRCVRAPDMEIRRRDGDA